MSTASEEGPRFTTPAPWNHQPGLWIATILSVIYSYLALIIRHVIIRKTYTRADAVLAISYTLASCNYALVFAALVRGAGKSPDSISESSFEEASKLAFAGTLFLLLACGCAGCSQILQLEGIMVAQKDKRLCWICVLISACLSVVGVVTVSANCSPARMLEYSAPMCSQSVARWSVATALMVVNILVTSFLPCYLLRSLRSKLGQKIRIYVTFAFLLGNIPLVIAAFLLYIRFIRRGPSGTGIADFMCCLQAALGWALICPTIVIARPMSLKFTTHGILVLGSSYYSLSDNRGPSIISEPSGKARRSEPFYHDVRSPVSPITGDDNIKEEEQSRSDDLTRRTVTTDIRSTGRY